MFKQVVVETTSRCNLKCRGCYRDQGDIGNADMSMETFCKILEQVNWPCTYVLFSDGEPFLHPHYGKMLELACATGNRVQFCTNGTLWREDVSSVIRENENLDNVCVSLDAFRKDTALAIRGTDLEVVEENVKKFSELPVQLSVSLTKLGQPWDEVEDFILYWVDRVDMVIIRNYLDNKPFELPKRYCNYLEGYYLTIKSDGGIRLCERNMSAPYIGYVDNIKAVKGVIDNYRENFPRGVCKGCTQVYSGTGQYGQVAFKGSDDFLYFKQDYFNQIYSRYDVKKGLSWEVLQGIA